MSTHFVHSEKGAFYFVTFTCHKWLPLIEESKLYNYLPTWANHLKEKGLKTSAYVAMPNHLHFVFFVEEKSKGLNYMVGEGKRFMAYEIVKRLKKLGKEELLSLLAREVQEEERKKGEKHQVFKLSFDAKLLESEKEILNVMDYIHHNPVSGRWGLVEDFTKYMYSSASFYELGITNKVEVWDYREWFSESSIE